MYYKNKPLRKIVSVIFLFILTAGVLGQTVRIDQNRMSRDLRIMEGILDKLFKGKSSHRFFNGHTKAVFLPDFGVVFHLSQEGPVHIDLGITLAEQYEEVQAMASRVREKHEDLRREMEHVREEMRDARRDVEDEPHVPEPDEKLEFMDEEDIFLDSEKIIEEEEKTIDNYKQSIIVFLRNYSPAIGQLQSDNKIAVLINLNDWQSVDAENAFLTAWVLRQDVDLYRRNQISDADFEKRIHFQLAESESDIDMDISILSEIFDRAWDSSSFWGESSSNNGIYLNGLGVLLFMNLPGSLNIFDDTDNLISVVVREDEQNAVIYSPREPRPGRKKSNEKSQDQALQEIQDELFQLMASYGHTLRIQPQESVVLNVDLKNRLYAFPEGRRSPSRMILQLKKKDLDEYNRGMITLTSLKNKLIRQTY